MTRTDTHRPSVINPEEYEFVAFEHEPKTGDVLGDAEIALMNRKHIRAHMERTGGTYSRHEHGGNCGICGNVNAVYTAQFYHKPTNSYVRVGRECCEKLDAGVNFDHFIRGVKNALEAKAGKRKAQAYLEQHGLQAAWAIYEAPTPVDVIREAHTDENGYEYGGYEKERFEEATISDIVAKLVRFGSISEKQTAFLGKLLAKIEERPAREAARKAEADAAQPVPVTEKRITIRGKVLAIRVEESPFYYNKLSRRMLVQAADGWKVWGSVPTFPDSEGSVDDLKGSTVEFNAKIKPSNNDPKFGYFSRPTKAKVIEEARH